MGILPTSKTSDKPAATAKRKSIPMDFSQLKPLNPGGALGFSQFRDREGKSLRHEMERTGGAASDDMESDEDEALSDKPIKDDEADTQETSKIKLSPEDIKRQGELADGVQKIKVSPFSPFEVHTEPVSSSIHS